jgi:hypothetical protein
MQLRINKGAVLNAGDYLRVGDFLFAVHASQPYGYCAVLQPDGDLEFFYASRTDPTLGLGPTFRYFTQLADAPGHVYRDPAFTFSPGSFGDYFAAMQGDGNFCIYRGTDPAHNQGFCWSSNTWGQGTAPFAAILDSDGNLRVGGSVHGTDLQATWGTNLDYPSQRVVTGDHLAANQWLSVTDTLVAGHTAVGEGHAYMAWLQSSDFVLACGSPPGYPLVLPPGSPGGSGTQEYWVATRDAADKVHGRRLGGGLFAIMQTDGNFVI